jgi:hypothetical protein
VDFVFLSVFEISGKSGTGEMKNKAFDPETRLNFQNTCLPPAPSIITDMPLAF